MNAAAVEGTCRAATARVTVICALPSEAAPLVRHWRLQATRDRPFKLFESADRRVIVSGIGSHSSAVAVGFAAGLNEARTDDIWLNAGLAGHAELALGTAVVADRISHHGRDGVDRKSVV